MSYTACIFHIVFSTKRREQSLNVVYREQFRRYMIGVSENLNCHILGFNYMPDHVHVLANLSADVALAKFTGTIKQSSSLWLKKNPHFAMFDGWAKEYYGVSVSPSNIDNVKGYISNQANHHSKADFGVEIKWLVESIGMQLYEDSFK